MCNCCRSVLDCNGGLTSTARCSWWSRWCSSPKPPSRCTYRPLVSVQSCRRTTHLCKTYTFHEIVMVTSKSIFIYSTYIQLSVITKHLLIFLCYETTQMSTPPISKTLKRSSTIKTLKRLKLTKKCVSSQDDEESKEWCEKSCDLFPDWIVLVLLVGEDVVFVDVAIPVLVLLSLKKRKIGFNIEI